VFPLVVGFPANPAVIGTGGTAPSADAEILTHSILDGELLEIKYSKSFIRCPNGSHPRICRKNTGDRRYYRISKYSTVHEFRFLDTHKGARVL
jgi:hypothetical protein